MVKSISALRFLIPLRKPFFLPGANLLYKESALIILEEGGKSGVGAFTDFPGSPSGTMDDVWRFVREKGGEIIGEDQRWALNHICAESGESMALATPFTLALEAVSGLVPRPEVHKLPLAGPVWDKGESGITEAVTRLIKQGFWILKVEGGIDVGSDIQRVRLIQSVAGDSVRVRMDCHQGYSLDDARRFVEAVDTARLELLEQPFPRDQWEETAAFAQWSPVPVMLDESIQEDKDLEHAAAMNCCRYVKCSLARSFSIMDLIRRIRRARELGFQVVVGSDMGCEIYSFYEGMAAAALEIETHGDMNGFLQQRFSILEKPLAIQKGCMVLPKDAFPMVDLKKLEPYIINRIRWAGSGIIQPVLSRKTRQKKLVKTKRR